MGSRSSAAVSDASIDPLRGVPTAEVAEETTPPGRVVLGWAMFWAGLKECWSPAENCRVGCGVGWHSESGENKEEALRSNPKQEQKSTT